MLRKVPGTAPVALGRGTGDAEVSDKGFAHSHLLLLLWQSQRLSCGVQTGGESAVQTVKHRVAPLVYRQCNAEILRQAVPLERGVVGVFDVRGIADGGFHPVRQHLAAGKVYNFYRSAIYAVCAQQNLEIRALDILVQPCFSEVHAAVCFKVK